MTKEQLETYEIPRVLMILEKKGVFSTRHGYPDHFVAECRGGAENGEDIRLEVDHPIASKRVMDAGDIPYPKRFRVVDEFEGKLEHNHWFCYTYETDDLETALVVLFKHVFKLRKTNEDAKDYVYGLLSDIYGW